MVKRDTIFNYIKDNGGGWCPFNGNMGLKKGDILRASLFCDDEIIKVEVIKHYRYNMFYVIPTNATYVCEKDLYLVDKDIIDEILLDDGYFERRIRKKTDRYVARNPGRILKHAEANRRIARINKNTKKV